jgi:hypothetical protein
MPVPFSRENGLSIGADKAVSYFSSSFQRCGIREIKGDKYIICVDVIVLHLLLDA